MIFLLFFKTELAYYKHIIKAYAKSSKFCRVKKYFFKNISTFFEKHLDKQKEVRYNM